MIRCALFFLLSSLFVFKLAAQTCCSGGVPVSANLGLPTGEKNQFQMSLSMDFNQLNTLKSGTEKINDDSRLRNTNAILFEFGYAFSEKFSIDIFGSFVQQKRTINSAFGVDLEQTKGIGDVVTLGKFEAIDKLNKSLIFGLGIKWPIGPSDLRNTRNLPLNADLQPGSGAPDLIGLATYVLQMKKRPSLSWQTTTIYSVKGKNNKYLGNSIYQFGKEWQLSSGFADQINIGAHLLDVSLLLRYRKVERDEFDLEPLPSTGGEFLFIKPGITYWVNPKFNVFVSVDFPLYSNVDGTQLAPTRQINFGVYYKLNIKKQS